MTISRRASALLARLAAVPHPLARWKVRFPAVALVGETVVGRENAFVLELAPANLAPTRLYISAGSHLVLREESPVYIGDTLLTLTVGLDYSDFRVVSGIRVPFAVAVSVPLLGRVVLTHESVTFDATIDPKVFK